MKTTILFLIVMIAVIPLAFAADSYMIEVSNVSPKSLTPGTESTLSFVLDNTGNKDLSDISFSWEEKTGKILPIGASNTKTIEELEDGEDETLSFDVFTSSDATPGLFELTLTLKYSTGNATATQTSKVGIIVGGETDFDVVVSDISNEETTLSVSNIGRNPADSVMVSIPSQSNFRVGGGSSSIIGKLEKGDYSIVSFSLVSGFTRPDSGVTIPQTLESRELKVEIAYTDTTGTRKTVTKTVMVQPIRPVTTGSTTRTANMPTGFASRRQAQSSSSNLKYFIVVGAVIICAAAAYVLIRKRRKKKMEEIENGA